MPYFSKSEIKEFGKLNFDYLLMTHILNINQQLSKLPHEMMDPNLSRPIGQTYEDIITSYYNLVVHLEELLKPYHDETYKGLTFADPDKFTLAHTKFGMLMELCNRKGFLFTKIATRVSAEND